MGEFRHDIRRRPRSSTLGRSGGEYRELHRRVAKDDLPRFEREFKDYLNQNTIRDIAGFSAQLNKHGKLIRDRIETINQSLEDIDYNDGRYIRLIADTTSQHRRPPVPVRPAGLHRRHGRRRDRSDQYSEQKFLQVKRIIDRFKGREGMTDIDRNWTRRVTDVRQWFVFSASERWRDDDTEYEHYSDSAGKSGGQKEKLAYTILAASLAYQFKLDWGAARSKAFRFVVIDEAFSRGSEASTRYALSLFTRLGLQLLIVTPLQKIHVIEPHVSAVGFVDNPNGNYSRLQSLTITECRRRRRDRDGGGLEDVPAAQAAGGVTRARRAALRRGPASQLARRCGGGGTRGVYLGPTRREPWQPVGLPVKGPTAGELLDHLDEARQWSRIRARSRSAAPASSRVEYRTVRGRNLGANRIPARVRVESFEQLCRSCSDPRRGAQTRQPHRPDPTAHPASLCPG